MSNTCKAEICAADTGCKLIQALHHILEDLSLSDTSVPTTVFNDNQGTVDWSKSFANRGHVNIQNMVAVRESEHSGEINIIHIPGAHKPSDLLTKEHKDTAHFTLLRNVAGRTVQILGGCWEFLTLSRSLSNPIPIAWAFPYMSFLSLLTPNP